MAASGGKRSVNASCSRFEGRSASEQLRSAEWIPGQSQWNTPNQHPSAGAVNGGWSSGYGNIDYNKPWFELKEGDYYCNLCSAWATEGHVLCEKHAKRAATPEWYGWGPAQSSSVPTAVASLPGGATASNAPAVLRDQLLPEPWTAHMSTDHNRQYFHNRETKESVWDWPKGEVTYSTPVQSAAAAQFTPSGPTPLYPGVAASMAGREVPPWLESREGEWYCCLCSKWATDTHLSSDKHQTRASHPEWYGYGGSQPQEVGTPWAGMAAQQPEIVQHYAPAVMTPPPAQTPPPALASPAPLPLPWRQYIDASTNRPYFHNPQTDKTQWDRPIETVDC